MKRACLLIVFTLLAQPVSAAAQNQPLELLRPSDVAALPSAPADHRIAYGADSLQFGELRLPDGAGPFPVAVVIHGGCWLSRFATLQSSAALADALRDAGIASWNVEYRHADHPGGAWPGTFNDVAAAADHVRQLARDFPLDTTRVAAVGHSAGGHLALWVAARPKLPPESPLNTRDPLRLSGVVALGAPPNIEPFLGEAGRQLCGEPVIERLLGGTPDSLPSRMRLANPVEHLPLGVPTRLMVGEKDLPMFRSLSEEWVVRAEEFDEDAAFLSLEGAGHFEPIAPGTPAAREVVRITRALLREREGGASSFAAHDNDAASDSVDVLAAAESFLSAFSNLEWEAFHSRFAPSATVFLPFREPWRKEDREEAAAFFRGFFDQIREASDGPPYGNIVPEDLRIQMLGDAAVVTFHLSGTGTVGRRTLVLARDTPDGPWRIVHLHASVQQLPEESEGDGEGQEVGATDHERQPTRSAKEKS